MQAARTVREIAAVKGAKPGQIALVWLLQKGDDIVPIPGTKHRHYLEENVAQVQLVGVTGFEPATPTSRIMVHRRRWPPTGVVGRVNVGYQALDLPGRVARL
jgi:hypothetical protein